MCTVNINCSHSCTVNIVLSHSIKFVNKKLMFITILFVFHENELDVLFIAFYYPLSGNIIHFLQDFF
jgi:hypothetical protein